MTRTVARLVAVLCVSALALAAVVTLCSEGAVADSGSPGPDHDRLNALIGEWTMAIRHWNTPESEPVTLIGSATRKWVLGGRFVEEQSENVTSKGGHFRSIGYLGYDSRARLYERLWMTNTATRVFTERGRYNPDDNLIRLEGAESDPASGIVILTMSELKIESPDRHVFAAYVTGASGVRWKQLEIVYSKK